MLTRLLECFGGAVFPDEDRVITGFHEKAGDDQVWVNMGFMIMEPEVFEYFGDRTEMLEVGPFNRIVADEEHCHDSF